MINSYTLMMGIMGYVAKNEYSILICVIKIQKYHSICTINVEFVICVLNLQLKMLVANRYRFCMHT